MLRRELLDSALIVNERHLRWILTVYLHHFNEARPHQALAHLAPVQAETRPPQVIGPEGAGVCAGQAVCGGAWVVVNSSLKASRCGQLSGRWSVMRRDRRAIRAGTVIRWRRSVPVRAVA
jgi:hypothetical protein